MFDDKKERNCGFINGNDRFRYRAGAIIIENGCVLVATNEKADYYYSIGGAVHLGETSEEAALREAYEETGEHYEIDRLAFVFENFFRDTSKSAIAGYDGHEITFFYLMKPRGTRRLYSDSVCPDGKEYVRWLPLDKLAECKVFPRFFAHKLKDVHGGIEHIVNDERAYAEKDDASRAECAACEQALPPMVGEIGKCGFYCGSCPDFNRGECDGCEKAHKKGDCYTRDCVKKRGVGFCCKCTAFPCAALLTMKHATVLDRDWISWQGAKRAQENK